MTQQIVLLPSNYYDNNMKCATIINAQAVNNTDLTDNFIISFPNTPPTPNSMLTTDENSNLSWVSLNLIFEKWIESPGNPFIKRILASKSFKTQVSKCVLDLKEYDVIPSQ